MKIQMMSKTSHTASRAMTHASRARTLFVALLGLVTLVTCVQTEDATAFFLKGNAAVTAQEQCVARPNPRSMRSYGTMDTWMRNRYKLFPITQNYMATTAGNSLYGEKPASE